MPRDPETLAERNATAAVNTIRMTDEIDQLLPQLDLREAEVLKLPSRSLRGAMPRSFHQWVQFADLRLFGLVRCR
jgi:hypothetical protein